METISKYPTMRVTEMRIGLPYQRNLESSRLKRIKQSMQKDGYWAWEPVVISSKNEVIDGQHRLTVARELKIERIPFVKITLDELKGQAELFRRINDWVTKLKPIDYWYARYLEGCPLAKLIYRLAQDKESMFFDFVAIKGHDTKYKLNMGDILFILPSAINYVPRHWERKNDGYFVKIAETNNYETIIRWTDELLSYLKNVLGSKKENPLPYYTHNLRAICAFFCLLAQKNELSNGFKKVCDKMKSLQIDANFSKLPMGSKILTQLGHYNQNKKNKIQIGSDDLEGLVSGQGII